MTKAPKKKQHYHYTRTNPELWRKAQMCAKYMGLSMQDVITMLLEDWTEQTLRKVMDHLEND